ncbi:MAG: DJ-1/PfpI family protein [Candidatus Nanoarchaeia archaeon]
MVERILFYRRKGGIKGGNMKVLMIVAQKNFRDEELFHTKEELEKAGHEVKVASLSTASAVGMLGAIVKPDLAVKDAKVDDFAAIVIVGGSGSPELAEHKEVLNLIKDAAEKGKILAAICLGPVVLAKAGILEGKKATVWSSPAYTEPIKTLTQHGAKYSKENIVESGKIITASGPQWARDFGKAIARKLSEA